MKGKLIFAFAGAMLLVNASGAVADTILFGGIGGHNISAGPNASANDGALAIVDQNTAAITIIGHPAGVARIAGLAFDATGALFATTQPPGGFPPPPGPNGASDLLRLDPVTGVIITSVPVTANGTPINIADLAVQPGTDSLFGVRGPNDGGGGPGNLYVIDRMTGVATLLGNTGHFFDTIAFAPDGTLYLASADRGMGPTNSQLSVIDPTNAATIRSVATEDFLGALAVRSDGVIFGGNGDDGELFTINPLTGAETLIGSTGLSFVGDLDFAVPEPGSLLLFGSALTAMAVLRRRRSQDI
jgi:outer membrane protein assembly factor BamB